MGLGCGMSMVKYLLFAFNLVCALCGIALIAIGSLILSQVEDIASTFDTHNVKWAPILTIAIGCIIFLIAFFGCCGAIRESYCMTMTYSTILMVLLIAKLVIGIYVLVNTDEFKAGILKSYNSIWTSGNQDSMAIIQTSLQCCGNSGPEDYFTNFPRSCCKESSLINEVCTAGNHFNRGCKGMVAELIDTSSKMIGAVALTVAAVELAGFVFSCLLASSIRSNRHR